MNQQQTRSGCRFETLERREFLAGDLFADASASLLDFQSSRGSPAAHAAVPLLSRAVSRSRYPQVVGTWVGSCKTVGKRRRTEVAVRITRQVGGGATGKFALGPATTWHKVLSTAVVSPTRDRSFRVILQGDTFYGSVTATVSANGRQIVGRWTCNSEGNWKVGTLVLDRR